jgi:hypothetical protein
MGETPTSPPEKPEPTDPNITVESFPGAEPKPTPPVKE